MMALQSRLIEFLGFAREGDCVRGASSFRFCRDAGSDVTNVSALPCLTRRASFAVAAGFFLSPARAEPSVMKVGEQADDEGERHAARGDVAAIATRYLGATGPRLGLSDRLWCGEFASMVRRKAGLKAPDSRRAVDQAQHARRIKRPVVGALMITGRRGGAHVDIIVSVLPDGRVVTVGGNVSRVVAMRVRTPSGALFLPV